MKFNITPKTVGAAALSLLAVGAAYNYLSVDQAKAVGLFVATLLALVSDQKPDSGAQA